VALDLDRDVVRPGPTGESGYGPDRSAWRRRQVAREGVTAAYLEAAQVSTTLRADHQVVSVEITLGRSGSALSSRRRARPAGRQAEELRAH